MDYFEAESFTKILDALVRIAPGAGFMVVTSVCFKIMGEKPSSLLQALAALLWGWKRKP